MPPSAAVARTEAPTGKKPILGAQALAQEKWASSGLTNEQAKKLGLRGLSPEETKALGPTFHPVRALLIPYYDLDGKKTSFYRVRYLEKLPGWAGAVEKPQRYAQPPGTLNEVYLPPILPVAWKDVAADPKIPIYITEGELKSACACSHGLACIGLGGVDVWRSAKREIAFLPELARFKWDNREVVIIYDSDAATNPNVVRAQRKLAEELVSRGALPSIASLPPRKDGSKQGLDDLIVAEGPEALNAVLRDAPSYPEASALWAMNEEVAVIGNPGMVIVKATGQKMEVKKFTTLTHANRHYMAAEMDKNGNTILKKKKLAPRWIEWERRHDLSGITYLPGKPRIIDDKWNDWGGWGVEPKKGDVDPWHRLLDFIFRGHAKSREWFERWAAYPLQHPGTKMYSAPLIWGRAQGTGKTLVAYSLMRIYGPNAIEIKNKHLKAGFNAWQINKQFIYGDEIEGNGDVGNKKIDAEWLKGLITQHEVPINQKYLPEYTIPDLMNYMFTSNKPDAVFMDDADRRFMIHEVVGGPCDVPGFYDRLDKWLKGDGPAALFHYLLLLPLGDFNPRAHAPWTMAKEQMILNSKSDVGGWVAGLREAPEQALAMYGEKAAKECDLYTLGALLRAYDPEGKTRVGVIGLGKELQKAGIRQINAGSPVRTTRGIQRLYAVRNADRWCETKPKEAAAHWDRFFGVDAGKVG